MNPNFPKQKNSNKEIQMGKYCGFPTYKPFVVTDARRYILGMLESGSITIEEYSAADWVLTSARFKSWCDDVKILPCDYIKECAKAVEIEFQKWFV